MELKLQINEVLERFPKLRYNEVRNTIEGELFISKSDSYEVLIILTNYPALFPVVYEVGERIPNKMYRHMYTDTGSCCFTTQAKSQILLKTRILNLYLFIKEIVIPYFRNNSYFELNGEYNTSEYSHGSIGVLEGYQDILQTNNNLNIARLILNRIEGGKLKIHDQCFCGSGQSLKKCNNGKHSICYKDFRKIDIDVLKNDLYHFDKVLNQNN